MRSKKRRFFSKSLNVIYVVQYVVYRRLVIPLYPLTEIEKDDVILILKFEETCQKFLYGQ